MEAAFQESISYHHLIQLSDYDINPLSVIYICSICL